MANKVPGASKAVGYWGNDLGRRVRAEQLSEKIRALLQDKVSRGRQVFLWLQATEDTPNSLECSCIKNTTDRADITCNSCYGIKFIPGYVRFNHETLFLSSISLNAALINVKLDTDIKPNRILLDDTSISGSITSSRLQFVNPLGLDWDFKCDFALINENNLVSCTFSTDGICFHSLDQINDIDKKPVGVGGIYLQISMSRPDINTRSPEFEVVRIRHATKSNPCITILRPWVVENPSWVTYGRRAEQINETWWTAPLDFFDPNIPANTPLARITENALYEIKEGINVGIRYATTKPKFNEEFGTFTHQSFEARRTQPEEVYNRLVF